MLFRSLPKDRYYLYRSHWNNNDHTVYLLPHWTWPGREGQVTPVYCYTDANEAELFVNGKSQGRIKKQKDSRLDRFRLRWNNVAYEPGEIRVVAYDNNGTVVGEDSRKTAGKPAEMKLDIECPASSDGTLKADGMDLAYITVSLVDKNGTFCPTLSDNITIKVEGNGSFEAACNGDATSLQPMKQPEMALFSGKTVFVVRSSTTPGTIKVTVFDKQRKMSCTKEISVK